MAVTIKGLGSLQAKLTKLDPLTRAAIRRGVGKGAALVEGHAKNIVPVDNGDLKGSIHTTDKYIPNGASASVGTNMEYAARIEFGFLGEDSLGRYYNNPAQPYLQPSLQKNKNNIKKIVMNEVKNAYRGI